MRRRVAKFLLLCALCLAMGLGFGMASGKANAAKLDESLARLLADSYGDTITAIGEIAASGEALAPGILEALADSRLQFSAVDKIVVITGAGGKLANAATGAVVASAPADLTPVRLNNRVRTADQAALGAMT